MTFMWYSNVMFLYYMFKGKFVTLVSLKVPSGCSIGGSTQISAFAHSVQCH